MSSLKRLERWEIFGSRKRIKNPENYYLHKEVCTKIYFLWFQESESRTASLINKFQGRFNVVRFNKSVNRDFIENKWNDQTMSKRTCNGYIYTMNTRKIFRL